MDHAGATPHLPPDRDETLGALALRETLTPLRFPPGPRMAPE